MRRNWIMLASALLGLITLAVASPIVGAEPKAEDGRTKSIVVEYSRAGGLQVTFFDDLKPEVRADFLKTELENYVRIFKPQTNYTASAFDANGKNLGGAMIYVADRGRVISVEQFQQGR